MLERVPATAPVTAVESLTEYRIFTRHGTTYRGNVLATDRLAARDAARQMFSLHAGWDVEAYAPGESPGDDPMDMAGGLDEHPRKRRW